MAENNIENINKDLDRRDNNVWQKHDALQEREKELDRDTKSLYEAMKTYGESRIQIFNSSKDAQEKQREEEKALQDIEKLLLQFEQGLFAENLRNGGIQFERSQVTTISLSGKDRERAREANKDFVLTMPDGYKVSLVDGKKPASSWCKKIDTKNTQELRIGYLTMKKLDGKEIVLTGPNGNINCKLEVPKETNDNGEIEAYIKSLEAPKPTAGQLHIEATPLAPTGPSVAVAPSSTAAVPPLAPAPSAPLPEKNPPQGDRIDKDNIVGILRVWGDELLRQDLNRKGKFDIANQIWCQINVEKIITLDAVNEIFAEKGFNIIFSEQTINGKMEMTYDLKKVKKVELVPAPTPKPEPPAKATPNIAGTQSEAEFRAEEEKMNTPPKTGAVQPPVTPPPAIPSISRAAEIVPPSAKQTVSPTENAESKRNITEGTRLYDILTNQSKTENDLQKNTKALNDFLQKLTPHDKDAIVKAHLYEKIFNQQNLSFRIEWKNEMLSVNVITPKEKVLAKPEAPRASQALERSPDTSTNEAVAMVKNYRNTYEKLDAGVSFYQLNQLLQNLNDLVAGSYQENLNFGVEEDIRKVLDEAKGMNVLGRTLGYDAKRNEFIIKDVVTSKEEVKPEIEKSVQERVQAAIDTFFNLQKSFGEEPSAETLKPALMELAQNLSEMVRKEGIDDDGDPNTDSNSLITRIEKELQNVKIGDNSYNLTFNYAASEFDLIQLEKKPATSTDVRENIPRELSSALSKLMIGWKHENMTNQDFTKQFNNLKKKYPNHSDIFEHSLQLLEASRRGKPDVLNKSREEIEKLLGEAARTFGEILSSINRNSGITTIKEKVLACNNVLGQISVSDRNIFIEEHGLDTTPLKIDNGYSLAWDKEKGKLRVQINSEKPAPTRKPKPLGIPKQTSAETILAKWHAANGAENPTDVSVAATIKSLNGAKDQIYNKVNSKKLTSADAIKELQTLFALIKQLSEDMADSVIAFNVKKNRFERKYPIEEYSLEMVQNYKKNFAASEAGVNLNQLHKLANNINSKFESSQTKFAKGTLQNFIENIIEELGDINVGGSKYSLNFNQKTQKFSAVEKG